MFLISVTCFDTLVIVWCFFFFGCNVSPVATCWATCWNAQLSSAHHPGYVSSRLGIIGSEAMGVPPDFTATSFCSLLLCLDWDLSVYRNRLARSSRHIPSVSIIFVIFQRNLSNVKHFSRKWTFLELWIWGNAWSFMCCLFGAMVFLLDFYGQHILLQFFRSSSCWTLKWHI